MYCLMCSQIMEYMKMFVPYSNSLKENYTRTVARGSDVAHGLLVQKELI